jgi:hypothetical protein
MVGCLAAMVAITLTAGEPGALMPPDRPSERWWAGVDIGWVGDYDNTNLWSSGYSAGVSASWAINAAWSVGGRFGIDHWAYESARVAESLVPPGVRLEARRSTGSVQLLQFDPFVRYGREAVIGSSIGAFAEASSELAFIRPYARTEVLYVDNVGEQVRKFVIDESRWRPSAVISVGLTRAISDQSWVELFPTYRAVFDSGGTRELWSLSLGFRMRV